MSDQRGESETYAIEEFAHALRGSGREIAVFTAELVLVAVATWIVMGAWYRSWHAGGVSLTILRATESALPVGSGVGLLLALLFGLLIGLAVVFPFDTFKRIEGIVLLVALGTAAAFVLRASGGTGPVQLATAAVGVAGGILAPGFRTELSASGTTEFESRFRWLVVALGAVAAVGVFDATLAGGPELRQFVLEGGALVALGGVFHRFLEYDSDADVLLVGPQRAGKTYLIGSMAHSLRHAAVGSTEASPVRMNDALADEDGLYTKFINGEFDRIGATETGELYVYELEFPQGWIFRRRMTVRLVDYAGEHLSKIDPEPTPDSVTLEPFPYEFKSRALSLSDPEIVEEMAAYVNEHDFTRDDGVDEATLIPTVLSLMLYHADTVALIVPIDDFVTDWDEAAFPEYVDPERDVGKDRERATEYLRQYQEICVANADEKTILFVVTMTDLLKDRFYELTGERPMAAYPRFRQFTVDTIVRSDISFTPAGSFNFDMRSVTSVKSAWERLRSSYLSTPFVPIYVEIDATRRTEDGDIVPNLDPGGSSYPLRGLDQLLRRFRE